MAPFKSSLARSVGKLLGVARERDLSLRGFNQESRKFVASGPITATGGNKYTPGDGFIYHAFINPMNSSPNGIFEQTAGGATVNILIVAAGGGGGGGYYAGGGGGGGILEGTLLQHQPGSFTITAGAGGAGGVNATGNATNGGNSTFDTVTALGGGYGGSGPRSPDQDGGDGGSGGGASYYSSPGVGSALAQPAPGDFTSYGQPGGLSQTPGTVGGGGGGARQPGGPGGNQPNNINAGFGQPFPTWPSSVIPILTPLNPVMGPNNNTYGGGGGGAPSGDAGEGGGGAGGAGAAGSDYLGGGGGGNTGGTSTGGAGGDGIVLIRYSAT